jgi:hypothetical protein
MIHHVWTVLCSHAVIDQGSNKVSLLDVVEQLNIRDKPSPDGGILTSLDLMTLWARADLDRPAQGRGRVTFLSPSGEVNGGPFEYNIDLSQHGRNRSQGRFQALHISGSGRHIFRVELQNEGETEWRQVADIPLEIDFTPPDETGQVESVAE